MTGSPLALDRHDPYVVARLHGDIDIANVEPIRLEILEEVAGDTHGLIVDLSAVRYLDSAGVHMLFELVRKLDSKRQGVAIAVPDESPIRTLLKITTVSEAASVCTTVEACAKALEDDIRLY